MYWPPIFRKSLNPYSHFNGSTNIEQTPPPVISSPRLPAFAGLAAGRIGRLPCRFAVRATVAVP